MYKEYFHRLLCPSKVSGQSRSRTESGKSFYALTYCVRGRMSQPLHQLPKNQRKSKTAKRENERGKRTTTHSEKTHIVQIVIHHRMLL